jgi:DNA mismatch repair ATPase MutS
LEVRALGHPLIPAQRRVCNDFVFHAMGEVAILTGSNMAGKSTFIKTIGVNLCLAYAGGPVAAVWLRSLPLRLHTCIRISDSIADGFSYFYAEVKCLKRLLQELQEPHPAPVLYLIDEIFRGTNNRERLLGSRAYIQALLAERGCGLVATHDLELAHLAEQNPQVRNYHFRDEVQDGKLVFDYRLHPGPSPTTNALKIMALEGLPVPTQPGEK